MRRLVKVEGGRVYIGALLVLLVAGCSKSGTYIDVTLVTQSGLTLDKESVIASTPGKADLVQTIQVAPSTNLTLAPTGLANGAVVTVEAQGFLNDKVVVLDRARVTIRSGQRVNVPLTLTSDCSGVLSCTAEQTCHGGACITITNVTTSDAGADAGGGPEGPSDAIAGPDVSVDAASGPDAAGPDMSVLLDASSDAVSGDPDGGSSPDAATGCTNGTTQPCGAAPFNKKGACGLDMATCQNGQWVGCLDTKGADTCDPGNDNSCNGTPNEGCPCVNGATQACGHAAVGICKPGTATCQNLVWGACVGNVEPAPRDCSSSMDNDCDGIPDNTVDTVCKCAVGGAAGTCGAHPGKDGKGPCKAGTQTCVMAANKATSDWGACSGSVGPAAADTCDPSNDNNCNGVLNEGCPCVNGATQDCGHATVGICKAGKATCQNAVWGACVGNVEPAARDCTSAADNDCNGKPDNMETTFCTCTAGAAPAACQTHAGLDGKGICKAGSQSCVVSADKTTSAWGACTGAVGPGTEVCDAAQVDENCNGQSNEGCECVNGASVPCTCGPATTCTNGKKGTCSVSQVTMYRDADGDGAGDHTMPSQVCPGAAGYSTNADDCDDSNAAFKPGTSICGLVTQKRTCNAAGGGTPVATNCSQGCINGNCRTDGTIGVPGYVSCTNVSGCLKADGCQMDDLSGGCGTTGSGSNVLIYCDGPNDCPGQVCVMQYSRAINQAQCYDSQPADAGDSSYNLICDPLASTCKAPLTCTKAGRYPLYQCQ